jgi:hypothetical protein
LGVPYPHRRNGAAIMRKGVVMHGKRFVLWLFGALIIISVLFMLGTATLSHGKADVCRGYYDAQQRAACAATATVGPPPNMNVYH